MLHTDLISINKTRPCSKSMCTRRNVRVTGKHLIPTQHYGNTSLVLIMFIFRNVRLTAMKAHAKEVEQIAVTQESADCIGVTPECIFENC